MGGWRGQQAQALAVAAHPHAWLVGGVVLGLLAGHGVRGAVPLWTVAVCAIAAAAAAAGLAGRRARHAGGSVAILGAGALSAIALSVVVGSSWSATLIVIGLACAAPWLGGRYLHQQDRLVDEAATRARLQERSRIAQDMHDSLGHELNLLSLRAGAIELDPTLTVSHQAAASELRIGASSAITQLAAVIGVLRGDDPVAWDPSTPDVAVLVRRAAEAGMNVTLERTGTENVAPAVARCIHRVVQEGVTNAARHAPGSAVTVTIDSDAVETHVTVTNTQPGASIRRSPGSRTGLLALHERLQACGGTLAAGPHRGGFRLMAHVPHGVAR